MKINILLPAIGSSGGIDVIYQYAKLLDKKGHDVIIYKEIIAPNMHRYRLRMKNMLHRVYCTMKALSAASSRKSKYDRFIISAGNKTIRDADVIVATAWTTAYTVSTLAPGKGEKYYFVQDFELWDNTQYGKNSYLLPLKKIVISSWINEQMKNELGIGPFPVVYNGIDRTLFNSDGRRKRMGRAQHFLMLNHSLPSKGVGEGLEVFEQIRAEYPDCELTMFGMEPGTGLPDYVNYYRSPDKRKLTDLYKSADIFLFPSLREGWGLTPIEAMACGCVVVASEAGCVKDIGIHGKNMMISEAGNVSAMVENIRQIINDSGWMEELRHGGYRTLHHLDWEKSADKLIEIFESKV